MLNDPEEADRPQLRIRVYQVNRAGIVVRQGPVREVRGADSYADFNAMTWPPCRCPRCVPRC